MVAVTLLLIAALVALPDVASPAGADPVAPSVTIVLDAIPDAAQDFSFTSCAGAACTTFPLDDDADPTRAASVTGSGLAPTSVVDVDGEGPLTGVVQLSVGSGHACAVVTSGQVRCWGSNERGQLGNRAAHRRRGPVLGHRAGRRQRGSAAPRGPRARALIGRQIRCFGSNTPSTSRVARRVS